MTQQSQQSRQQAGHAASRSEFDELMSRSIYDRIEDPLKYSVDEKMCLAASAYTGCSVAQAPAVLMTCAIENITLKEYSRTYHNVDGKHVMKSQAMLANFRTQHGGNHIIASDTADVAAIQLQNRDGVIYQYEFSSFDAVTSRWPWKKWREALPHVHKYLAAGKQPAEIFSIMSAEFCKDNWATPTDVRNMLMRRCVSAAVDNFCPEVDSGAGSEWDDAEVVHTAISTNQPKRTTAAEAMAMAAKNGASGSAAQPFDPADASAEDAQFAAAGDPDVAETAPPDVGLPGFATSAQVERLTQLRAELNMPLKVWEDSLTKRSAKTAHGLKQADAQEIIDKLEARRRQAKPAEPAVKN